MGFLSIRLLDIIDIILVGYILYKIYTFIRGTIAIKIFVGFFSVYLLWLVVKALDMQLLSSILGQFMGVGIIALIIVFQQELRKFFLYLGSKYLSSNHKIKLEQIFSASNNITKTSIKNISTVCQSFSKNKTGALIVIARTNDLQSYISTGDYINCDITSQIIESIFYKNSPLHDGAIIIEENKIIAARCVLPLSNKTNLPAKFGMRHRAALGLTENTDAFVLIISEETGHISYSEYRKLHEINNISDLNIKLSEFLT